MLLRRRQVQTETGLDPAVEREHCHTDPLYFLTHYCRTINEHQEGEADKRHPQQTELIPDWPHIRALVSALWPPRDVVIEKSRRMFASWVAMAAVLHDLTFESWSDMIISQQEKSVDDGGQLSSWQSLFGKIRFLHDHLPPWLQSPLQIKSCRIVNTATGAAVIGYAAGTNPGRGGGFRRAICDEFAHVEHSEQVLTAVGPACPNGKVLISTPHGTACAFHRIRCEAVRVWPPMVDGVVPEYARD